MPLKGVKVIELVGLAPGPFCGQVLSDFGADVIRVDKAYQKEIENLKRGKKLVLIDLKKDEGKDIFKRLCKTADVVIETFRPGVMERLGLGPDVLMPVNDRLIYTRVSGFGQSGSLAKKAGHDINYLAISGILSKLGVKDRPIPPINVLGDYGGGGLIAAIGILLALFERTKSGKGQIIDSNLTEGTAYLCSWIWESMEDSWLMHDVMWPKKDQRMSNLLDGGSPFYRCYRTKDDKFMAVGSQEWKFYQPFVETLGLDIDECDRNEVSNWDQLSEKFAKVFETKTQKEWTEMFEKVDACVTPVLDLQEAHKYKHNVDRNSYFTNGRPRPAPILCRTPAAPLSHDNSDYDCLHTKQILLNYGYTEAFIKQLTDKRVIEVESIASKL
ncbi:alpha-methylacyl-CoA racemase-like [Oppia nitens]|uniref:alpha-methylacyl-CoA racemase-like n=1 Tax=Oppia nitens TaxID=1686743 RepID=UPI0023DB4EC4|nr:alpha-methylacyl-CoA racemase-like [Oppia nitens]